MMTKNLSNYYKHLHFENRPDSKEYALNRCIEVLGMIAIVKDRNLTIEQLSAELYGKSDTGNIITSEREYKRYQWNKKVIERLKRIYNYRLSLLLPFKRTYY